MSEEELEAEVLRSGLNARPLGADAMARIREATQREWRAQVQPQRRRTWPRMAIAAAAVMVAVTAGWMVSLTQGVDAQSPALGRLERVGMQGAVEHRLLSRNVTLGSGDLLRAGESVNARSSALIALANGGTLRLMAGTRIDVVSDTRIRLKKGAAYVDIPPVTGPAAGEGNQFIVQTPVGEVAHLGTQFEVALLDDHDRVRVRVREGQVALRGPAGQTALAGAGTELIARADGGVTRQSIATSGRDWAWVETLAPEFEIENRLLGDYLQWVSRETGRSLTLDAGAQKQAATTRLHGSVRGLTVLDSLDAVLETSALHLDTPDGMIRVSSGREVPLAEKSK
jgi:ferric-dicitrate binding protein FerR (iron transport regulator)